MLTIVDYIEQLKETYSLKSYYKAMEFLGMGVQSWTKIKAGGGISEKNAIRLAQALKIDPLEIIAVLLDQYTKMSQKDSTTYPCPCA